MLKLKALQLNTFVILAAIVFSTVSYAADLTIQCNPGDNSTPTNCDVTPSKTAAVFDESEYPLFDLKPGDYIERKITVTNNRDEICYFHLDNVVIETDTVASTGEKFSEELLTELFDTSGSTGQISFDALFTLTPLYLTTLDPFETEVLDWTVTFDPQAGNEFQQARLEFDFDWNFSCGEEPPFTELFLSKTNDKMGIVQAPGDQVTYTLTVTASDEFPVFNVEVIDLPPGGFSYVGGSWTAFSSVRGNIKNSPTTEPTYASPGTWQLGDMVAGEVVTLTYVTDISNSQESGLYKDIAWTFGNAENNPASALVMGNDSTGFFVGTFAEVSVDPDVSVEVEVDEDEVEEVIEEGDVLGISDVLPATGANNLWIKIVMGLASAGALFMILAGLLKRSSKLTSAKTLLFMFVLSSITFSSQVFAANVMVRLEEPESPSSLDSFYLNFVALDVEGRPVTVKCFKKAPGAATFTQFGSDKNLAAGGDDGFCQVNSGMLPDDGNYRFYVTAYAGPDSDVSDTVIVDYDSKKPGKPKYIEKDKDGSCAYEVTFKTADDGGDTASAKVYRSDDKEFDANSGTEIRDFTIGSNEKKTFTDSKPDCNKKYYYAVRAFSASGVGSDVRAETVETTVTTTKTSTTKETETVFGGILEAIAVGDAGLTEAGGEGTEDSEVVLEGDKTPEGEVLFGEDVTGEAEEYGEVLGDEDKKSLVERAIELWPLWLVLLVLYVYAKRRDGGNNTRPQRG